MRVTKFYSQFFSWLLVMGAILTLSGSFLANSSPLDGDPEAAIFLNEPPTEEPPSDETNEDDAPVAVDEMEPNIPIPGDRPWEPPNYAGQANALGYQPATFTVPAGMEERVAFWVDIYTQYSTNQGILHDSKYINLIYEKLGFSDIQARADLTDNQKVRARRARVKDTKKMIKERLLKLSKLSEATGLEGEDLRYWNLFEKVEGKDRFKEATHRKRLRFQLGQSDRFAQGIHYSGRYLRQMEGIFREEGLPIELTRLPFVESSFNLKARSRVGASGIWQFMPYTGRQFLKMNFSVDERNDPLKATRAAARLFKINYSMLETWPLAVTAYNHGPAGMRRLVQKENTNNLAELLDVRKGRFGFASANFYACFLAALEIERNAKKYFPNAMWMAEHKREAIQLDRNVSNQGLLELFGGDVDRAEFFNPHIHSFVWRGWRVVQQNSEIYVPMGEREPAMVKIASLKDQKPQRMEGETYRVQSGDTLSDIASRFGVTVHAIVNANEIANPRALRAGQKLTIPK